MVLASADMWSGSTIGKIQAFSEQTSPRSWDLAGLGFFPKIEFVCPALHLYAQHHVYTLAVPGNAFVQSISISGTSIKWQAVELRL